MKRILDKDLEVVTTVDSALAVFQRIMVRTKVAYSFMFFAESYPEAELLILHYLNKTRHHKSSSDHFLIVKEQGTVSFLGKD